LLQALQQFIQADTRSESQHIVGRHPELLSDQADAVLEQMIAAAQEQGDENAVRLLEEHRALLRRCQEVGVGQAFAEKMLPPDVPPEFRDDLRQAQEGEQRWPPGSASSATPLSDRLMSAPAWPCGTMLAVPTYDATKRWGI
jgi:hypothetical protein